MSIREAIYSILEKTRYLQVVTVIGSSGVVKVIELDDDCVLGLNVEVGRKETEEIVIPYDKIVLVKAWYYPEVQQ